jgi:hypothetical protein
MQDCRKLLIAMIFSAAVLLAWSPCAAEINLYLHSTVEAQGDLTLGDIASIDGAAGESLGRLVIPSQVYADGYCDRKELESLLSGVSRETICVYGSAVKVTVRAVVEEKTEGAPAEKKSLKAGEPVKVQVRKNGIVMELSGHAAQDGAQGEAIKVRIKSGKSLTGRLSGEGIVECSL